MMLNGRVRSSIPIVTIGANDIYLAAVSTGECNTLKAMQIAGVCHGSPNKDHLYR